MSHSPMVPFSVFILAVTLFGFLNGSLLALLVRRRRWYIYGLIGGLLTLGAEEVYSWYRLGYTEASDWETVLAYVSCGWIVANVLLAVPLAAAVMGSLWHKARRLCQVLGLFAALGALLIGMYGISRGAEKEEIHTVDVYIDDLPPAFEGFRIAQISDTHIGPYYDVDDLDGAVEASAERKADFLAITGDLIDDNRFMGDVARIFKARLREFPSGSAYIWGNHEYFHDRSEVREGLEEAGVPILENSHIRIDRGEASLYIAGVDYPWEKDRKAEVVRLTGEAVADIPQGSTVILLAHHPDFLGEGFVRRIPFTMAGHTHGMQFGLFGHAVITPYVYTRGMYSENGMVGYVSRGDGGWFPFRFGCSREIPIYVLHRK